MSLKSQMLARRLFLVDQAAHLGDIRGDLCDIALLPKHLADDRSRIQQSGSRRRKSGRARVSAMCSQVQASSRWYFSKALMRVATGPLLPEGRSRMSTS